MRGDGKHSYRVRGKQVHRIVGVKPCRTGLNHTNVATGVLCTTEREPSRAWAKPHAGGSLRQAGSQGTEANFRGREMRHIGSAAGFRRKWSRRAASGRSPIAKKTRFNKLSVKPSLVRRASETAPGSHRGRVVSSEHPVGEVKMQKSSPAGGIPQFKKT